MRIWPVLGIGAAALMAMTGAQLAHRAGSGDSATAQPGSLPAGLALPPGARLVPSFSEDFDQPRLDRKRWNTSFAAPANQAPDLAKRTLPGNAERQVYVDPGYLGLGLDPFRITGGTLSISADRLDPRARAVFDREVIGFSADRNAAAFRRIEYGSGMISQRGRFAQQYGYWEVRMRWTGGNGIWPAFWLLPQDGRWPPEIDIVEAVGKEPGSVFSSTHSRVEPRNTTLKVPLPGRGSDFHTYGALWLPDRIDYYLDGTKTVSIPTSPDMNQPMYAIVNLAIGGNWPGDPDAGTTFPARLDVDYVRIWKLQNAR